MNAVFEVLGMVTGTISGIISLVVEVLGPFSMFLFVGSFIGLLFTFLWFFFRFLDKKRLALPTVIFTLFFLLFLSGNILLIAHDARTKDTAEQPRAETTSVAATADQASV